MIVDDLHARAGSQDVVHPHGSLHSPRCIECGLAHTLPLPSDALPEDGRRMEPPRCSACNGYVRPGVVWFGEMLPEDAWSVGLAAAKGCDVFLSIGTSGIVYPAAELPIRAFGSRCDGHSYQSCAVRYQQSGALFRRRCLGRHGENVSRGLR